MKKTWLMALCIALCLALTLAGTISYLTDEQGKVNVMTVGRVEIHLLERQRGENGLEKFENHKFLNPLVGHTNDKDGYGLPTNVNFLDKIVQVESASRGTNAYLRVFLGVPSALRNIPVEGGAAMDALHLVMGEGVDVSGAGNPADPWPWVHDGAHSQMHVSIDGIDYDLLCYDYVPQLAPGDTTAPLLAGMYLDSMVDHRENGYILRHDNREYPLDCDLTDGLQIPVYVQAVQAEGFADRAQAFQASGMNDVNFDEEITLKKPQATLSGLAKELLDRLARILPMGNDVQLEMWNAGEPFQLSPAAVQEALDVLFSQHGQAMATLVVPDGVTVQMELGGAALPENLSIMVNEGGTLVLEAD